MARKPYLDERGDTKLSFIYGAIFILVWIFFKRQIIFDTSKFNIWGLLVIACLFIVGFCVIYCWLNARNKPHVNVTQYEKSILKPKNMHATLDYKIWMTFCLHAAILVSFRVGIATGNLLVLVLFSYGPSYLVMFGRFMFFMLDRKDKSQKANSKEKYILFEQIKVEGYAEQKLQILGRINVRYYLIKYADHYYVADYTNPRHITDYAPLALFKHDQNITVYDVSQDRYQFMAMTKKYYLNYQQKKVIEVFFDILWLVGVFFAKHLFRYAGNPHFTLAGEAIVTGCIFISLVLIVMPQNKIMLHNYPQSTLCLTKISDSFADTSRKGDFWRLIELILSFFVGVFFANWLLLIIFGFMYTYFVIFNRFTVCELDRPPLDDF